MIDLAATRAQLRTMTTEIDRGVAGFLTVSDWSSAVDAILNGNANPPCAYVSVSGETVEKNRYATGGIGQRVTTIVSVLFCLGASRADEERSDPMEVARGAILQNLLGFKAGASAQRGFHYFGYQLRAESEGLIWGEVLVSDTWDLRG